MQTKQTENWKCKERGEGWIEGKKRNEGIGLENHIELRAIEEMNPLWLVIVFIILLGMLLEVSKKMTSK